MKRTGVLSGLEKPAVKLAFSADGHNLAALASGGTTIRVWDLAKNTTVGQITNHRGAVAALALSPDGKMLATGSLDDKVLQVWKVAARELTHKGTPLELSTTELAGLWTDLGSSDYEKADNAWRKLGAAGDNAIAYLRQVIRPIAVPAADIKYIENLVAELDSEKFATREKAAKDLLAAGELAMVPLQRLLEKPSSIEAAKRAEAVLKKLGEPQLTPDRRRVLEATELLEQLRTAKAIALLEEIERDSLIAAIRLGAYQALQRLTPVAESKK
jgi:hypothetical protein